MVTAVKRLSLNKEQMSLLLGCGVRFFLSAALTGSTVAGGYQPFALGFAAAAGTGAAGGAALAGCLTGAALFLEFADALRFLAAAVLIFAAATAFEGTRPAKSPLFTPVLSVFLFLCVHFIYLFQSFRFWDNLFPCLAAAALTGVSARLYTLLLRQEGNRQLTLLYVSVTLLTSVAGLALPGGISPGRAAVCCLLLYTAYQQGMGIGAAAGICTGLAMDLCSGADTLFYAAAYGLSGLLAGLRSRCGRGSAAALTALAALLLSAIWQDTPSLLAETLLGCTVFLFLPGKLFSGKRVQEKEDVTLLDRLRLQLKESSAALRDLYDSFSRNSAPTENPAIIFDRAAEATCRGCALCDLCWQKEYTSTFNAMNDATPFLLERGRALPKDFPPHFSSRCIHFPELLTSINGELSAFLLRRQYRLQMEETRRSAQGQYAQLSDLLASTASHLGQAAPAFGTAPSWRVGAVLSPKEGESVSGDSISSFETTQGRFCMLLSDGMGTGEAARRESSMTLRLMERFLKAGIDPEAALKTLNSALSLRSSDTGSFTTIDLFLLEGDQGAVYKYGAAPSYVKRGGRVQRITGGCLPAGLHTQPAPPDSSHFPLEDGCFVVQISDGVADAGHDEWLLNLLAGFPGSDPQLLANAIVAQVRKQGQMSDDCAVQVLYLCSAGEKKEV
ncbi:SpoIIE family protein phosphatase [Oscillibacter sp. MSJ-2]|uniref:SpoIIE family protein phosphatase n=1 Tax=Dysosmobacter acutus TaxID=2841504 RepID=A0ABS6FA45_9FIRM|nr:SpoIIE family protein phosphatase [Dysosmobacter acutus]